MKSEVQKFADEVIDRINGEVDGTASPSYNAGLKNAISIIYEKLAEHFESEDD
jgi:uncharacterized protein (DUF2164 family)